MLRTIHIENLFLSWQVYFLFFSFFLDPSLGTGKETEDSSLLQHLSDACLVVDALEPSVREELVKNFCDRELISYQQIFEGAGLFFHNYSYFLFVTQPYVFHSEKCCIISELAKLDKTERRYAWVKRRLRTNEEIWKIFPTSWHVDYLLCIQFCKLTRFVVQFFKYKYGNILNN